jgi:hypothetical protein
MIERAKKRHTTCSGWLLLSQQPSDTKQFTASLAARSLCRPAKQAGAVEKSTEHQEQLSAYLL